MLDLAARLAIRAAGNVEPNPLVGAVVVKDGRVIGLGHHRRFGGPHAEVDAIASCERQGEDPRGATMFVTLEPCRHTGKTGPCTNAISSAGISRVVFACEDPGEVSGGGAAALLAVGVAVEACRESRAAIALSAPFRRRLATGLPWVIAKWAQTIDGKVAMPTGESQWISSAAARARVHRLRAGVDAIMVGIGTARADDPLLTARGVRHLRRRANRIVVDPGLELGPDSQLAATASEHATIVLTDSARAGSSRAEALLSRGVEILPMRAQGGRIDLRAALAELAASRSIATMLVEGGPGLIGSLFADDLIDECRIHIAPAVMGDERALDAVRGVEPNGLASLRRNPLLRAKRIGDEVELVYTRL